MMRTKSNLGIRGWIPAAGSLIALAISPVGAAVQATEVMDQCDKSLNAVQTWSMQVHVSISNSASAPLKPSLVELNARYVRDGDRRDAKSVSNERPVESRAVINGYFLKYAKSPKGVHYGLFAPDGQRFVSTAIEGTMDSKGALEGRLADPEPNTDLLRHSPVADTHIMDHPEIVDGFPCAVVTGSTRYGTETLWCDAAIGYLPRKMVIVKSEHDLIGKTRVGDLRLMAPGAKPTVPVGKLMAPSRITYTADSMKFQKMGTTVVPVSCRVTERYDFPDGSWYVRDVSIVREMIDLHPDLKKPGLFEPSLPEGTPLSNQEDHQIPYRWHDGKPVPWVNENTVKNMDATADAMHAQRSAH